MMLPRKAGWRFGPGLLGVLMLSATVVDVEHGRLQGAYLMAQSKQVAMPEKPPVYVPPPDVGAPVGRIGGGTRSLSPQDPGADMHVSVLAPDHVGLTTQPQPALYWYVSVPTSEAMTLTIRAEDAATPLLQIQLRTPLHPGIYRTPLAEHGVRLEPKVPYRWTLSLSKPDGHALEEVSSGVIQYVKRSAALSARMAGAKKTRLPYIYAEAGYWYDAVEAVSQLIAAAPDDTALRQSRAALSEQVGLQEASAYDRTAGVK